ncbi:MAG: hypothetical protein LV479_01535 [Methylacidiphilales bacterium]|nr:hypothetical protein [Candidatus Methylacidiphilales bacterium]
MKMRPFVIVSTLVFVLVALVHVVRLVQGWPVELGTMNIPLWVSGLAILVAAAGAVWGLVLLRHHHR